MSTLEHIIAGVLAAIATLFEWLMQFSFMYPLIMLMVWITGASYYFFYRERRDRRKPTDPPELPETPPVTYIVPCHNEAPNITETIQSLLDQDYPEFESSRSMIAVPMKRVPFWNSWPRENRGCA